MEKRLHKADIQVCMQPGDTPDLLLFRSEGGFSGDLSQGSIEYIERHPEFEGATMRVAWDPLGASIRRDGEYTLDIRVTHDGEWSALSYHTPYGDFPMQARLLLWDLKTPDSGYPSLNILYELLFGGSTTVIQLKLDALPA